MANVTNRMKIGLGKTLSWLGVASLLVVYATPLMAVDWNLGPLSITANDVVQIHFLNRDPSSSQRGIPVAIRFLDSMGKIVATGGGDCGVDSDICSPGDSLLVDSRHITTVSLTGASLHLGDNQSMLIQPIVSASGPLAAFLRMTLEQFSMQSSARSVTQYLVNINPQLRVQSWHLGPVTLLAGELARFSVTYCGPGKTDLQMFFVNANGAVLEPTPVTLVARQAASIDLDGDAINIAGVPGVIFAGVSGFGLLSAGTLDNLGGTLGIVDKTTGATKALLSLWGCGGTGTGSGTGSGGGGGGQS